MTREQMEDAAFWERFKEEDRLTAVEPIDDHAVYGRARDDHEVPVRNHGRDLVTAIRRVSPGDRVRVDESGGWLDVVDPDDGFVDEGFAAVPENGSVMRAMRAHDVGDNGLPRCRVRRWDDFSSMGTVRCLEVDWA